MTPAPEHPPRAGRFRRDHPAIAWIQRLILLAGVVLAFILFDRLSDAPGLNFRITPWAVLMLFGLLALSVGFSLAVWAALVRMVTGTPPLLRASVVGLAALMTGKYIPGKVFGLIGRYSSVHESVSTARATGLVVLEQIVLVCGMAAVATPFIVRRSGPQLQAWPVALLVLVGFVAVALIMLPMVRRRFSAMADALAALRNRRPAAWTIVGILMLAVIQALLVAAPVVPVAGMIGIESGGMKGFWLLGAYAGSILLGMIAFALPGGIGAREAAFVWLSAPLLNAQAALALAAALRLVNVAFDLSVGALGALLARTSSSGDAR